MENEIFDKPGVYKLKNKINGKEYVGETIHLKTRLFTEHKSPNNNTETLITKAINKYGWDNFEIEILQEYESIENKDILLALETAFIEYFDCLTPKGYNVLMFGFDRTGVKLSEKHKQKISEANSGENNYFYGKTHTEEVRKILSENAKKRNLENGNPMQGKHHTDETKNKVKISWEEKLKNGYISPNRGKPKSEESKKKMSEAKMGKFCGENNPNFGNIMSEENRKKISLANSGKVLSEDHKEKISKGLKGKYSGEKHWNYGKKLSPERIEKTRLARLGKPNINCRIPVKQIEKVTGEVIKIWDSATTAGKELGISSGHINNVCRKQKDSCGYIYQTAKGFKWEYVDKEISQIENTPILQ